MAQLLYLNQFKTTTLSVVGGIDDSQTTGIVVQSTTGLDTSKPGIAVLSYADPLDLDNAEFIEYESINSTTKAFTGVTRGAEGYSAKTHANGVSVAFPVSESHVNRLAAALSIGGVATNGVATTLDEDDMASDSATALATQQSIKAYADNNFVADDGWAVDTDTWVYASATSFTIAGKDVTGRFPVGTKIRYKQGGSYEYAHVASTSFSTDTTVNLIANNDYALADDTITDNYYSYESRPQGFPSSFETTCELTGFSTTENLTCHFQIDGNIVSFHYPNNFATSNATTMTLTGLPLAATRAFQRLPHAVRDNGSDTIGIVNISSTTLTFFKTVTASAFTGSGSKGVFENTVQYIA